MNAKPEQTATVVTLDLVTRHKGLVSVQGCEGGIVIRDGEDGWYYEDEDGDVIGHGKRSARNAALALARHHGVTGKIDLRIDPEYR